MTKGGENEVRTDNNMDQNFGIEKLKWYTTSRAFYFRTVREKKKCL